MVYLVFLEGREGTGNREITLTCPKYYLKKIKHRTNSISKHVFITRALIQKKSDLTGKTILFRTFFMENVN